MLKFIPSTVRITLCLVCLMASGLLLAGFLEFIPNTRKVVMASRARMSEAIAINTSLFATKNDSKSMNFSLRTIAKRHPDVESMGVRRASGELIIEIGDHKAGWHPDLDGKSTDTHMHVPITSGNSPWGTVEVRFKPITAAGWMGWIQTPLVQIVLFMVVTSIASYYWFLRRVLNQLNPSRVVPTRVKTALDTLAEGLIITDSESNIVLANTAFSKTVGRTMESIVGETINSMAWRDHNGDNNFPEPWSVAFETEESQLGVIMDLQVDDDTRKTYMVNSAPIVDEDEVCQGVLTSLEDVTPLEQKKRELHYTLEQLKSSSDEIRQQNDELERLATTDPLTDCLNRRSFFEQFEMQWKTAERHGHAMSCVMVDIDFFKSINDNHGHSVGDDVLKGMSATLRETARVGDLVCRFGGEEFCVLLPHTDIEAAEEAAERFRVAIEAMQFPNLKITASLGVSAVSLGASDVQQLLDQADKCLYVAKRNGRNQVVRWDQVPDDTTIDESEISRTQPVPSVEPVADDTSIPYRAVTALLSALAYRHVETASHCRRVADNAVAVAESLMPLRQCYLVEIAALLHDIGKIGVPDSILLKTEQLSNEDWEVMRQHDRIGLEIIRASFASESLSEIVENRKAFFAGSPDHPGMPVGDDIPQGARILAIADAFDSMTNDSVYRKAMSTKDACDELRSRSGTQFDPDLVERFIQVVSHKRTPQNVTKVSKETALDIGAQMERLAVALDDQDMEGLKVLADRLKDTASRNGVDTISEKADELERAIVDESELMDVLESAYELVEMCRSTQKAYIDGVGV